MSKKYSNPRTEHKKLRTQILMLDRYFFI